MANPVIYKWFKETIPANTPLEFQETQGILVQQKGLPELWVTMEFDTGSRQRLSTGRRALWREFGTCTAVFLAKAGKGPEAVQLAAQAFADAMGEVYQADLIEASGITGTLRIENIGTASADPYEDGNWLVCSVPCVYTYDSVRGAGG